MLDNTLVILCLIAMSAFFSISEIPLTASRKIGLKLFTGEDNVNTQRVSKMQENPGMSLTVIQVGLNTITVLGDIAGDAAFSPAFYSFFLKYFIPELSGQLSFILSFSLVTGLFILFVDLTPGRIGMIAPEAVALRIINPMRFCLLVLRPPVWFSSDLANNIFRLFKIPMMRKNDIIPDDIYAVVEAGVLASIPRKQGHELTENVFELESHTVPSSMTSRENIIWFDLHGDEQSLKNKVAEHPHSKFLVCNGDVGHIIGYVGSKGLLNHILTNQSTALNSGIQTRNTLIVPDTLTFSEALESFKTAGEGFAVIINKYVLMVRIITLNDVMTTLTGDLVGQGLEEQIVARDESSWLVDGGTPIDDVMHAPDIGEFPQSDNYETIGGFMMSMLRKTPGRTDSVKYSSYEFGVVDIDNYKIDQPLVARLDSKPTVLVPKLPDTKEEAEAS